MGKYNTKHTDEEVKEILEKNGFYVYDIKEYINNKSKIKVRDKNGFMYSVKLSNIISGEKPMIIHKGNDYTIENIKLLLKTKYKNQSTLISDTYKGNNVNMVFKCNRCGSLYEKTWCTFTKNKNKNHYCPECNHFMNTENQKLDFDFVKKKFEEHGYTVLDNVYYSNCKPLNIIDNLGYKGKMSYQNMMKNKKFYKFSKTFNKENVIYNINVFAKLNNINSVALRFEDEDDLESKIVFKCNCGKIFTTNYFDFINGSKIVCDYCGHGISKIEIKTEKFLIDNNIDYIREKTFNDFKNNKKRPYFFDFYLPKYNTCIECDGKQHFEKVNFGGISDEEAYENLKKVKYNDRQKDIYCKNNNIKLIRISYLKFNNNEYKDILKTQLNIN